MGSGAETGGDAWALAVPVLLLVIMACMGMELQWADFRRVREVPRAALVGLLGQMVALPLVGLAISSWPGLSPTIAVGVLLLTACPGGSTSNIFSYLAGANVALSVTLTALSSTLCFFTIPFWLRVAVDRFGTSLELGPPGGLPVVPMIAQLFVVTLLPIAIGMAVRASWPEWSERVRLPLRRAATGLMAGAIVLIVGSEWSSVLEHFRSAAGLALTLVITTLASGYLASRAAGLELRDAFTLSIEIGLQNGALATMIIVSLLGQRELIVFPGTYAVLSLVPVALWTLWMRRRIG